MIVFRSGPLRTADHNGDLASSKGALSLVTCCSRSKKSKCKTINLLRQAYKHGAVLTRHSSQAVFSPRHSERVAVKLNNHYRQSSSMQGITKGIAALSLLPRMASKTSLKPAMIIVNAAPSLAAHVYNGIVYNGLPMVGKADAVFERSPVNK